MRNFPRKLLWKFLPHKIMMLRGSYSEFYNEYKEGESLARLGGRNVREANIPGQPREMPTLSFLTDQQEIFVWGFFHIPSHGQQFISQTVNKDNIAEATNMNE